MNVKRYESTNPSYFILSSSLSNSFLCTKVLPSKRNSSLPFTCSSNHGREGESGEERKKEQEREKERRGRERTDLSDRLYILFCSVQVEHFSSIFDRFFPPPHFCSIRCPEDHSLLFSDTLILVSNSLRHTLILVP